MAFAMAVMVPDYVLDERSFEFEARTRRHSTSGAFFGMARPEPDAAADDVRGGGCFSCFDPASREAIAGLRVPAAGETREECCAVCLEDLDEDGGDVELRTMPCSHSFHQRCIFRWLRVSRVCPCCRFPLPSA
ncbi:unnamed protein product [Alopecurus aequalis]